LTRTPPPTPSLLLTQTLESCVKKERFRSIRTTQ
jgi:hypothetical protein